MGSIWALLNKLSHFFAVTGSHIDRIRGSRVFDQRRGLISTNRIFTAVSEKSTFTCKKARANVFLTYLPRIIKHTL